MIDRDAFWVGFEDGKNDWANDCVQVAGMKVPVAYANNPLYEDYKHGYACALTECMENERKVT